MALPKSPTDGGIPKSYTRIQWDSYQERQNLLQLPCKIHRASGNFGGFWLRHNSKWGDQGKWSTCQFRQWFGQPHHGAQDKSTDTGVWNRNVFININGSPCCWNYSKSKGNIPVAYNHFKTVQEMITMRNARWLLRQLEESLGHHLSSLCKHKKYGTALYRTGGDLLNAL